MHRYNRCYSPPHSPYPRTTKSPEVSWTSGLPDLRGGRDSNPRNEESQAERRGPHAEDAELRMDTAGLRRTSGDEHCSNRSKGTSPPVTAPAPSPHELACLRAEIHLAQAPLRRHGRPLPYDKDRMDHFIRRRGCEVPERERDVYTLIYTEGLSRAEAAHRLGLSPNSVQTLLRRLRKRQQADL